MSNVKKLLEKISETLKEKGVSEHKAQKQAGISIDFIRDMRRYGNPPKTDKLLKLAKYLDVPVEYFLAALDDELSDRIEEKPAKQGLIPVPITTVYIRGEVQAGHWKEAIEWAKQDWIPLAIPVPDKYKNFPRYALYVRGDSMNLVFPEGTVVIVINFEDLGANPENGDCVVTLRRDHLTDNFEATLKVVQIRDDGRVFLWPRSDNPDFLKPIILPYMTQEYQHNGMDGNGASAPDLIIQGLIVGSYRPMEKLEIR